jgi:hypothetical protein
VQGLTYLASFSEGSVDDQNEESGVFQFGLTRLNVAAGTQLTITANYVAAVVIDGQPILEGITRTETGVEITWAGGTLQSSASVLGPWDDETSTSPFQAPSTESARFFRLRAGADPGPQSLRPPLTSPFSNVIEVR